MTPGPGGEGAPEPALAGCAFTSLWVCAAAWSALLYLGYDLYQATEARVPESPYLPGQYRHHVLVPLVMAGTAALTLALTLCWRRLATPLGIVGVVEGLLLIPFLLTYTGGV